MKLCCEIIKYGEVSSVVVHIPVAYATANEQSTTEKQYQP